MLEAVAARQLRRVELELVHVTDESDGCTPTDAASACEQERTARLRENAIDASQVIENLFEDENIQSTIFTS